MKVPFGSAERILALVPTLVAIGSVVLEFVLIEFFGMFFLLPLSLLVYVGVGLVLTLRTDLLGAVQLTMAPAHSSLWLRERAR
jgi:hypothetical protein